MTEDADRKKSGQRRIRIFKSDRLKEEPGLVPSSADEKPPEEPEAEEKKAEEPAPTTPPRAEAPPEAEEPKAKEPRADEPAAATPKPGAADAAPLVERSASGRYIFTAVSDLLGGATPATPGEKPAEGTSALLEGDRLAPARFQTKTKKLLSKRLERPKTQRQALEAGPPVIRVEALDAFYDAQQILFALSFEVQRGEILAILGGSGSGKTTLLKHLIGLLQPRAGKIEINGSDISQLEGDDLALVLKSIGMLFQYSALFGSLTIGENVALPLREYTDLPDRAIDAIVRLKLSLVGLPGIERKLPNELSGGMKKRAALARALALDPDVLFFDEPASGLDPIASAQLDDLIRHLNRSFGTTMVIVTHDLENAFNVAHRILMLDRGKIAAIGTPDEIKGSSDPWVRSFLTRKSAARDAIDEDFFRRLESKRVARKSEEEKPR